jgi:hypothetical protein
LIPENDIKEYEKRSYQELSSEFQTLYPTFFRVVQLIPLMYNCLTLIDNLSHKEAIVRIYDDHQHLPGFSKRNIRRNLPLDNTTVPRRIRPSRPKNSQGTSRLGPVIPEQNQNASTSNNSDETNSFANNQNKKSNTHRDDNRNDVYAQNVELKQTVSRLTTFTKANDISKDEIEFEIPKDKIPNIEEAIQKIRNSLYVVFDKSGMFMCAIPDIYRGK